MRERLVFTLLHCVQWLLSETLCAEALGVTQCSLHQSSNEPVATLALETIKPRTNFLPGGSVFQSTGPPSRLPPFLPQLTPTPPPPNLYDSVWDTQKRYPLRYMVDDVPFKQERKCVFSYVAAKGAVKILSWDLSSNKLCSGNSGKKKSGFLKWNENNLYKLWLSNGYWDSHCNNYS